MVARKFSFPLFLRPSLKKLTQAFNELVSYINTYMIAKASFATQKGTLLTSDGTEPQNLFIGSDDGMILKVDSSHNYGLDWFTPDPPLVTGDIYDSGAFLTNPLAMQGVTFDSATNLPADTLEFQLVFVPHTEGSNDIAGFGLGLVTTTTNNIKMGLFKADQALSTRPGPLIEEVTYTTTMTGPGTISVPFAADRTLSGWYWVGIVCDVAITPYRFASTNSPAFYWTNFHQSTARTMVNTAYATYTNGFYDNPLLVTANRGSIVMGLELA